MLLIRTHMFIIKEVRGNYLLFINQAYCKIPMMWALLDLGAVFSGDLLSQKTFSSTRKWVLDLGHKWPGPRSFYQESFLMSVKNL